MKRSPVGSILEFLLPIIFMLFVLLVRNLAKIEDYDQQTYLTDSDYTYTLYGDPAEAIATMGITPPTTILKYFIFYGRSCEDGEVVVLAPTGDAMVNTLKTNLEALDYTVATYASNDEIDELVRDFDYGDTIPYICFGVTFENSGSNYKYHLRFNMTSVDSRTEAPQTNANLTRD